MFQLVDAEKANYTVAVLCEVLEVSRSGYYDWKKRPCCERSKADAQLAVQIAAAHTKSGKRYGSRAFTALFAGRASGSARRGSSG